MEEVRALSVDDIVEDIISELCWRSLPRISLHPLSESTIRSSSRGRLTRLLLVALEDLEACPTETDMAFMSFQNVLDV